MESILGVGKSFFANKVFEYARSTVRFVSNSSTQSVTAAIQQNTITFNNKTFTIADTPGFFDTSNNSDGNVDNKNMCKLVKALESCEQVYALIFVFTDRFSTPHQMLYDRIVTLVSDANRGKIILLHNKVSGDITEREIIKNEMTIDLLLGGGSQRYFCLRNDAPCDHVQAILEAATTMNPFELKNLQIPEICYEKEEQGPEYEEELTKLTKDEGHQVEEVKDTSHFEVDEDLEKRMERGRVTKAAVALLPVAASGVKLLAKIGAAATEEQAMKVLSKGVSKMATQATNALNTDIDKEGRPQKWVPGTSVEKKWVPNEVTHRVMVTYVNVYKVRFDGTRDLVAKKEIGRRDEVIGADKGQ